MSLATETKELSDKYQALLSKSFKDNAELFKRFTALYTDGAKEFSSGLKGEPRLEMGASLTKLAELNIAYWTAATQHSLAFGRDVATAYEKAFGLKDPTPAESKVEISVSARLGGPASAAFQLENKVSETLHVSPSAGDIRSPGGEVVKAVPVIFNPATLSLAPKAQAVVQVSLDIPNNWQVGGVYTLPVKLAGFPSREILIRLHIGPAAAGAGKAKAATAKAKKSRRSKSA